MNIVFDFDGTLVYSFPALYDLNAFVAKSLFKKTLTKENYSAAFNGSFHKEIAKILDLTPEQDKLFREEKKKLFNFYYSIDTVRPIKELESILSNLSFHSLFILTAAPKNIVKDMLIKMNVEKYFNTIISSEESSKYEILSKMSVPTLFVTDTVGDVIEGKKAGVKVIGVSWGFHSKDELLIAGVDVILNDTEELAKIA